MNTFYLTRYRKFHPELKHNLRILMLSDLHFSNLVNNKQLSAIIDFAKERKPHYIFFAGDLIDCQEEVDQKSARNRLLGWLRRLGEIAPTIIIPGNHDYYRINPDYKPLISSANHWIPCPQPALVEETNKLDNVHYLVNEAYEDDNIFALGFTASPSYYQLDREDFHSTIFNPGSEDKEQLIKEIEELPHEFLSDLPKNKANFFLFHSPVYLQDPEITKYLSEFDYFISGHMHNGCVPPLVNEFWKSNRGIIGPGKIVGPEHVRFRIQENDDRSLILGALTTVQKCAHPISFLQHIYPTNVTELVLSTNKAHEKPDLKFKYISY